MRLAGRKLDGIQARQSFANTLCGGSRRRNCGFGPVPLLEGLPFTPALAVMKWYAAMQSDKSGNEDKSIILLSQATIEDPDSYEPWVLLGQIYSRKGDRQLALELYQEALALFDQKTDYLLPASARPMERDMIRKNIDALQMQLKNQKMFH
jgi:cytochrome c-type biogenesis protein CcmH/NrfG